MPNPRIFALPQHVLARLYMAYSRKRNVIASRRKRDDEGEEEGSLAGGDIEDDSLSEGSVSSIGDDDAEAEGSEISADNDVLEASKPAEHTTSQTNGHAVGGKNTAGSQGAHFVTSKDTEAMINGLRISDAPSKHEEISFEDITADTLKDNAEAISSTSNVDATQAGTKLPKEQGHHAPHKQTDSQQNNDKQSYLKEMANNPTFVPNRGGFFLHDNRVSGAGANGFRGYSRGRGRGFGPHGGPMFG